MKKTNSAVDIALCQETAVLLCLNSKWEAMHDEESVLTEREMGNNEAHPFH